MQYNKFARAGAIGFVVVSACLVSCSSKHPEMMSNDSTPSSSLASAPVVGPAPVAQPETKLIAQNTNLGASSSGYSR